jgi:hypothetical protein
VEHQSIEIRPANDKKYNNKEEVQKDWDAGRDFQMFNGLCINKQDADERNLTTLVRYGPKLMKVMVVT